MMDSTHEAIVTAAGGKYLGTLEGFVWFDAVSHSTLVVKVSEFSEEMVRARLKADASKHLAYEIAKGLNTGRER